MNEKNSNLTFLNNLVFLLSAHGIKSKIFRHNFTAIFKNSNAHAYAKRIQFKLTIICLFILQAEYVLFKVVL